MKTYRPHQELCHCTSHDIMRLVKGMHRIAARAAARAAREYAICRLQHLAATHLAEDSISSEGRLNQTCTLRLVRHASAALGAALQAAWLSCRLCAAQQPHQHGAGGVERQVGSHSQGCRRVGQRRRQRPGGRVPQRHRSRRRRRQQRAIGAERQPPRRGPCAAQEQQSRHLETTRFSPTRLLRMRPAPPISAEA
jgi:hypothetical protein